MDEHESFVERASQKWTALMEAHSGDLSSIFERKPVSGDEHPSGLRDVIRDAMNEAMGGLFSWTTGDGSVVAQIESAVRAWLSVVSEEEIAAREALADLMSFIDRVPGMPWQNIERGTDNPAFVRARIVLARTSGLPKETQ